MITGNLYYFHGPKEIIEVSLVESIRKYQLVLTEEPPNLLHNYSNGKCGLRIYVSDIQSLKWNFHDPKSRDHYVYNLSDYMEFVLGKDRPRKTYNHPVQNLRELVKGTLDNFNREIIDYLGAPMNGDFTWHGSFVEKHALRSRCLEFAYSTNRTHSEQRRTIARMFRRKEEGWQKAIESYFELHYLDERKED